jgi:hypothetical protein
MCSRLALTLVLALLAVATLPQSSAEEIQRSVPSLKLIHIQGAPRDPDKTHKGVVGGKVLDAHGKPVGGATVTLKDSITREQPLSSKSDKDGKYLFKNLFPGEYSIQAEYGGLTSQERELKVNNGTLDSINLTLQPSR